MNSFERCYKQLTCDSAIESTKPASPSSVKDSSGKPSRVHIKSLPYVHTCIVRLGIYEHIAYVTLIHESIHSMW